MENSILKIFGSLTYVLNYFESRSYKNNLKNNTYNTRKDKKLIRQTPTKVIIYKSHGEVSLLVQDTIENVSYALSM